MALKVGVLQEQGYFGEGLGFHESTGEEAEKVKKEFVEDCGNDQEPIKK